MPRLSFTDGWQKGHGPRHHGALFLFRHVAEVDEVRRHAGRHIHGAAAREHQLHVAPGERAEGRPVVEQERRALERLAAPAVEDVGADPLQHGRERRHGPLGLRHRKAHDRGGPRRRPARAEDLREEARRKLPLGLGVEEEGARRREDLPDAAHAGEGLVVQAGRSTKRSPAAREAMSVRPNR
jgi:hypothetical protein